MLAWLLDGLLQQIDGRYFELLFACLLFVIAAAIGVALFAAAVPAPAAASDAMPADEAASVPVCRTRIEEIEEDARG